MQKKKKYVQADVLNGVLAVVILNVRKWEALGHARFLQRLRLVVVVVDVHVHRFVLAAAVSGGVGLDNVHVSWHESEKVGAKVAEVGDEASREDEDDGGHARSDNEGG